MGVEKTWALALGSTLVISVIPNLILYFIPHSWIDGSGKLNMTKTMLSFASGGLLGDVFLHTLPHLLMGEHHHHDHEEDQHDHHHGHGHLCCDHEKGYLDKLLGPWMKDEHSRASFVGLNMLLGFFVFFVFEKMMMHGHSKPEPEKKKDGDASSSKAGRSRSKSRSRSGSSSPRGKGRSASVDKKNKKDAAGLSLVKSMQDTFTSMKTKLTMTGWLNLVADSLHNFTDGLAIGASFASGQAVSHGLGIAAFLSVLFHEIPHELGDFTILIKSGLTRGEAIRAQFITAIAAFLGTITSLVGANNSEAARVLLLAWTAGGFLYIATTGMIPTVLETDSGANGTAAKQSLLDASGFALGVVMMLIVLQLE